MSNNNIHLVSSVALTLWLERISSFASCFFFFFDPFISCFLVLYSKMLHCRVKPQWTSQWLRSFSALEGIMCSSWQSKRAKPSVLHAPSPPQSAMQGSVCLPLTVSPSYYWGKCRFFFFSFILHFFSESTSPHARKLLNLRNMNHRLPLGWQHKIFPAFIHVPPQSADFWHRKRLL